MSIAQLYRVTQGSRGRQSPVFFAIQRYCKEKGIKPLIFVLRGLERSRAWDVCDRFSISYGHKVCNVRLKGIEIPYGEAAQAWLWRVLYTEVERLNLLGKNL